MSFLSLLLAVITIAQDSVAPPAPARKHHRPSITVTAPMARAEVALQAAANTLTLTSPELEAIVPMALANVDETLQAAASTLTMSSPQLEEIAATAPMWGLQTPALAYSEALGVIPSLAPIGPMELWMGGDLEDQDEQNAQDPADSLYRAARQALNNNNYTRAADLFRAVRERYPRSDYVPNSYYWEAFALYRTGSDDQLKNARTALRTQADQYPDASTRRDAEALLHRIQGVLAQHGDADAAAAITEAVDSITPIRTRRPRTPRPPRPPRTPRVARAYSGSCDDEDDIRTAALNAMLQMDADRAVPILKAVLARRDSGSTCLRRKAMFLVSQKRSSETASILLDAVRNDPDQEVREQGVFWLSQVPGDETVAALDSILRASDDEDVQEKAIFALSQHRSPRAAAALRAFAERGGISSDLREKAIFWIGQSRSEENASYLRGLYSKLDDDDLKDKVLFSVSQMGGAENYRWLMDIALNENENIELRKKALFWAGQGRSVDVADLVKLYDSMRDREMREQLIFVFSQRHEAAALDKLFSIGKNDPDRELRKKAIFWIGQSRDPRAAQFLQELINQ